MAARLPNLARAMRLTRPRSFICARCQTVAVPARALSTTPPLLKKKGKANLSHAHTDSTPPVDTAGHATAVDNAFDFSTLESRMLRAIETFTHELSKLRAGGRMNTESIEDLKVVITKGEKATLRIGELAQVVPKGRVMTVIVADADHVKPIKTAIASSWLGIMPQGPTDEAPTTLTVPVPPPTGETKLAALATASKLSEEALHQIREARGAHQKKLRAMGVAKTVRPDDLQKAQKQMDELVKKHNEDVKRILDNAKKALQG
ncbi:ribosome recycling factor [Trichodelitschia bisporula]|uniref:Ribosome recycling factor n=1 Tax=Trichodelitschia bisporula TaxID=703511 RepID=A0A6G1HZ05_9PEZI|nr:ribosome recycling factor [Trichodelitschia bisporula]